MHDLHTLEFCRDDTPWCYFVVSSLRTVDSFAHYFHYWRPSENHQVVVRVIQGRHCDSIQTLFQEWAAALQFPYYFGHNWAAFDECITDLEWLPGKCYVIFVTQLNLVLPQHSDDFQFFVDILRGAHDEWKIPNRYNVNEPTAPFTVVFHAEPDRADAALARLRAAGADPVEARFSDEFIRLTTDRL